MGRAFAKDPASARSPQRQPGRSRSSKELSPGALDAMAEAARRARSTAPDETMVVTGAPTSPGRPPPPGSRTGDRQQTDRRLVISIGIVAVALVLVTAGLIGSLTSHGTADPTSSANGDSTPTTAPTTVPTTTTPSTTSPSTTSTTAGPAAPAGGAAPVLSSLAPTSGVAGQAVAVAGANLLSSDGSIVARFGGQVAPTDCSTPSTCTVTVPSSTGSPTSIPVTITTSSGTSNPLTFDYGSVAPTTAATRPCGRSHGGRPGCGAHGGPRSHGTSGPHH
jgi:IPT/TIG domain